jgi:hypothetical protein
LLIKSKKIEANIERFKQVLNEIWFELYKRETNNDSSGFEHVFLGENRHGETTGFHNWI